MTKVSIADQTRKEVQLPGSSMHESLSQLDDDNVSEDSFGSDFGDNATDEEDLITDLITEADTQDVEPDSPPPVYSDEEYPQSSPMLLNMDLKSPPLVLQYTPTSSTQPPILNANSLGPSTRMCIVSGLTCNQT